MSTGAPASRAIEVVQRSGPKHGADEILAFFAQLAKASMQANVIFPAGDDTHAVDVHRGWGSTDASAVDQTWVLNYRIEAVASPRS